MSVLEFVRKLLVNHFELANNRDHSLFLSRNHSATFRRIHNQRAFRRLLSLGPRTPSPLTSRSAAYQAENLPLHHAGTLMVPTGAWRSEEGTLEFTLNATYVWPSPIDISFTLTAAAFLGPANSVFVSSPAQLVSSLTSRPSFCGFIKMAAQCFLMPLPERVWFDDNLPPLVNFVQVGAIWNIAFTATAAAFSGRYALNMTFSLGLQQVLFAIFKCLVCLTKSCLIAWICGG